MFIYIALFSLMKYIQYLVCPGKEGLAQRAIWNALQVGIILKLLEVMFYFHHLLLGFVLFLCELLY